MSSVIDANDVEVYHGTPVHDPFRWLEDRHSARTESWLTEQKNSLETYFQSNYRLDEIRKEVRRRLDRETVDQPVFAGGRYFCRRRLSGEAQPSICVSDRARSSECILVSPSRTGAEHSASLCRVSDDGHYVAYEWRQGGEDRSTVRFVDAWAGEVLPDEIPYGRQRGLVFSPDGAGYFYCQEIGGEAPSIRYRRFGDVGEDEISLCVPTAPNGRLILTGDSSRLGAIWLRGTPERMILDLWTKGFSQGDQWRLVCSQRKYPFCPLLRDDRIFAIDYAEHPDGRLLEIDVDGTERLLFEDGPVPLQEFAMAAGRLFLHTQSNESSEVGCWTLEGGRYETILSSSEGTFRVLSRMSGTDRLFLSYESFDDPGSIYELDPVSCIATCWYRHASPALQMGTNVWRRSCQSKDGTEVPVTIVRPKSLEGTAAPTASIMTAYGAFGIPMTPRYSTFVSIMLERGATFVVPHVRGGGEVGSEWHEEGRGRVKQNAFDDFIAAAEWLCNDGLTTPRQLGIFGGSNSGLLVGAVMTQRPVLFGAVLCIAPLLDMIRYEKFDHASQWVGEYGTVADEEDFRALLEYSPYHRIQDGIWYPATFLVAGDRDQRCNAAHARKMAARLLAVSESDRPILLDHDPLRGHRPVMPLEARIEAVARRIYFFCRELGMLTTPEAAR